MRTLRPDQMKTAFAGLLLVTVVILTTSMGLAEIRTGPGVGERIPVFQARDQNGEAVTFQTLRGPKGLLLLFHRSADW